MKDVEYKEKSVTITHSISIDACIADEIKELNNGHDIFTLSSCCGHGDAGYIVVAGKDIQRMISLGYEHTSMKYLDNDIIVGDINVLCAFKPKSKCHCTENCQICYPHSAHQPGKCEYCDCGS